MGRYGARIGPITVKFLAVLLGRKASEFTGHDARASRAFTRFEPFGPYRAGALTDDSGDAPDGANRKCEA